MGRGSTTQQPRLKIFVTNWQQNRLLNSPGKTLFILTTDATVAEVPKEEKPAAAAAPKTEY